jgi:hypothetical protein
MRKKCCADDASDPKRMGRDHSLSGGKASFDIGFHILHCALLEFRIANEFNFRFRFSLTVSTGSLGVWPVWNLI